eukprot:1359788-Amorphochlora_amoeboformis.AAC.1
MTQPQGIGLPGGDACHHLCLKATTLGFGSSLGLATIRLALGFAFGLGLELGLGLEMAGEQYRASVQFSAT